MSDSKKMEKALIIQEISKAGVSEGKEFGPCLLGPDDDGHWTIGGWDGRGWFDLQGFPIDPQVFAILPLLTALV